MAATPAAFDEYRPAALGPVLAIAKRSGDQQGVMTLPKWWTVERSFARLLHSRRLVRDIKHRATSAEAMAYRSMILPMTRRLARSPAGEGEPAR